MGTMRPDFKPNWWNDEHMTAWERIKEAVHRDWVQTKKDVHAGGHELNQGVKDTVKQAMGKEPIPSAEEANPPKVIGDWDEAEVPIRYGYGARTQYGAAHPRWDDHVESTLRSEWESARDRTRRVWDDVKDHVRRGYEYRH